MFLHLLNDSEKRLFALAADHLIAADEILHELELEVQESLEKELGIPWPHESATIWSDALLELGQVQTSVSKRVILLELSGVAYADQEIDPREIELLSAAARAMGLSRSDLEDTLDFAPRAHSIHAEGQRIVLGAKSASEE